MPATPDEGGAHPRVALPLLTLVPGAMGGSETYVSALTRHLALADGVTVECAVPASAEGFSLGVTERVRPRVSGGADSLRRLLSQVQAETDPTLRRWMAAADVVHYPLSVPAPAPPRRVPWVQTLLDVQHLDLPDLFTPAERAYRAVRYDRPARRADAVITISEFSKTRIVEHLGISADRVHVAHLGVDAERFVPHLGAREPFLLYPARGWKHKNHERLVEAVTIARREKPGLRLVLTGGGLDHLTGLPSWVDVRGNVTQPELHDLYRRAACLVFPSLYEGFGLPPLEAMASGCPVAASDAGAIPEVCGDAAVLFDGRDPTAIAAGVLDALGDQGGLAVRGLERVGALTWEKCADVHVQVYRRLAQT